MLDTKRNNLSNNELCKFLLDIGFTDEEVIGIILDPSFFVVYYDKIHIMVKRGYDDLVLKKFEKEKLRKMILKYPGILTTSNDKKDEVEEYFRKLGMSNMEIRNLLYRCPNLYGYSVERTKKYFDFFKELGYSNDDMIKIYKIASPLFHRKISTLKMLVNDMKIYGFSMEYILILGKNYPLFWTQSFSKVKEVVNTLIDLKFTKEQAITVIIGACSLVGYNTETIKKKINDIVMLGFSFEEVVNMINKFPILIVSDIERIRNIVDFFNGIGLHDKLIMRPKNFFMQGVDTSYARYMFYKDRNIEISGDDGTYGRLFYGWNFFEKSYKVTKKDLLERYNYKKVVSNAGRVK